MEIKEIAIGGIDRHTPVQDSPNGVCEELINVRPETTGLQVYREGTALSSDLDMQNIHIHRWGNKTYYIGINPSSNVVRFSLDGTTLQTLQWVSSAGNTDIKSIGNMLIISDKGANGKDPSTKTWVLEEKNGEMVYSPLDKDLPLPLMKREDVLVSPISSLGAAYTSVLTPFDSDPDEDVRTPARTLFNFIEYIPDTIDWPSFKEQLKATLRATFNRVTAIDKHLAHGYVLLGTSVTLYDGTETAFSNLMCVDLSAQTPYRDAGNLPTLWQIKRSPNHFTMVLPQKDSLDGLFVQYKYEDNKSYWGLMPEGGDLGGTEIKSSYFHTLTPVVSLPEGYGGLKDYVKSVNLWVSKPYDKIDWETFTVRLANVNNSGNFYEHVPTADESLSELMKNDERHLYPFAHIRRLSECKDDMHKQLLFKQKEWTVDEILKNGSSVSYECEFGSSEGTLGDTLSVDAWSNKRAGTMFTYNNRVHMFDSVVKVEVPDSELQCLSGWDDEWYISQVPGSSTSGDFWHMKFADSYISREAMRGITLPELKTELYYNSVKTWLLGLYHDSTAADSTNPDSYDWYYCSAPIQYPNYKFVSYLYLYSSLSTSSPAVVRYLYLSEDGSAISKDFGRAKYLAVSSEDNARANELSWYSVPEGSYSEATTRRYRNCNVFAYLKQDSHQLVIKHENIPVLFRYTMSGSGSATMGNIANISGFLTYPDARCERLVIQYAEGGVTNTWETPLSSEDSTYNFAYAYIPEGSAEFIPGSANTDVTDCVYEEKDVVNVSALNNPTVFPVSQSYRFIGEITGMALALEELNSTQTGSYPVYVLTNRGVYALNQGTGGVLYATITPVNTDNCVKGKSVQVHRGVVYLANGRVYWLIGRNRTDILAPLDGDPDLAPRNNSSYPLACKGTLYDVTSLLSSGTIEDYVASAEFGYDSFHNELIVSNPSYGYSYVFNFEAKRWFKISGSYGSMDDHHILTRAAGGTLSVESPASGVMTVGLLAVERGARITHNWVATHDGALSTTASYNAGDYLTLRLGDTAVASLTLQAPATIPAALSLLTKNLSWMETDTVLESGTLKEKVYIYSSATLTGQSLTLTDESTSSTFTMAVSSSSGTATTTDKLIGAVFSLAMTSPEGTAVSLGTATVAADTTVGSLCLWIASSINSSSVPFTASAIGNKVMFSSGQTGTAYNGWTLGLTLTDPLTRNISQSVYVHTSTSATSGGADSTSVTPASGSIRLLDMTQEKRSGDVKIHIQTRPMKLTPMAFGVIQRMIARVRATLSASQNLSVYVFTSDNLEDYKCSAAEQRSNCTIDRIRLERTPHGRKYTVLVIGGIVPHDTELSTILCQLKVNAPRKIR